LLWCKTAGDDPDRYESANDDSAAPMCMPAATERRPKRTAAGQTNRYEDFVAEVPKRKRGKMSVADLVESAVPVHAVDVMEGAAVSANNDSAAPMYTPAATVTPNNAENSGGDTQLVLVPAVNVMEGAAVSANDDSAAPMCMPAATVTPNNAENSGGNIQLVLVPAVDVMEGAAVSANDDSAAAVSSLAVADNAAIVASASTVFFNVCVDDNGNIVCIASSGSESLPDHRPDEEIQTTTSGEMMHVASDEAVITSADGAVNIESNDGCILSKRKIAKKGQANPQKWKRNDKALKRMHGEKRVQRKCNCNCCSEKMSDADRKKLFDDFWLVEWNRKRDFINANTSVTDTARKTAGEHSRRKTTVKYFLPTSDGRIPVCKQYFLATLDVGTMFVRCTLSKSMSESFASAHGNVRRPPPNKTPSVIKTHAINFVKKFPTMPSHYCRKDSKLMYLEAGLTVSKVYEMYKKHADSEKARCVSMKVFRQIFQELNLGFFHPRKDQCDICQGQKQGLIAEPMYDQHIQNKEQARHYKAVDKEQASKTGGSVRVFTMDLQQLLLCPKSFSSAVYYKRKLCVHNFTLYDTVSKDGFCYLWHEGEGGLDSDEFASIVTHFLRSLPDNVQSVVLWSDGCTYQNRNAMLSSAILRFIQSREKPLLCEIHQKYLTKGHTQMEVDSMHAAIETASKNIEVFTPQEWETIIKAARPKQPYHVTTVDHTFWQNFPSLVTSIRPGKMVGDPLVTDLKHIVYTASGIFYSLTHGTPVRPLPVRRQVQMRDSACAKYKHKLPLASAKITDLKDLCKSIIPQQHRSFYESLF